MDNEVVEVNKNFENGLLFFQFLAHDQLLMDIDFNKSEAIAIIKKYPKLWEQLNNSIELKYYIELTPFEPERIEAEAKLFKNNW